MSENVKILALEAENVKRIKAVSIDCGRPLTIIGGRNAQGKTSAIDAIMWALGGDRYRPSTPVRDGEEEAYIKVTLDNGIVVERKGVNGTLKVSGKSGGQTLLNEFVNSFALDLPAFLEASDTEKAKILLDCFPELAGRLQKLKEQYDALYAERLAIGRDADRKAKYADELPYDEAMAEHDSLMNGADMAREMEKALSVNAGNRAKRVAVSDAKRRLDDATAKVSQASQRVQQSLDAAERAKADHKLAVDAECAAQLVLQASEATAKQLQDIDTTAAQKKLVEIDDMNARIRANLSKRNAEEEAGTLKAQYNALSEEIERVRAERLELLATVAMPLPDLSIGESGQLVYRGMEWDCMSGMEQMQVGAAICAAMKPECGFILLDKLEAMDVPSLKEFGTWLDSRGLQGIGTRVSSGDECSLIIEDGLVQGAKKAPVKAKLKF